MEYIYTTNGVADTLVIPDRKLSDQVDLHKKLLNAHQTVDRACIAVSVHSDDEIYLMASMMFNYPFTIFLLVPFLGDMNKDIDVSGYNEQRSGLYKSIDILNAYRQKMGYENIIISFTGYGYRPDGFKTAKEFTDTIHILEEIFDRVKRVDYYIRTCSSTHQNHTEANRVSNCILRSPYLDKIDCILQCSYPNDFAVGDVNRNTAYQDMDEVQANLSRHILDNVYGSKCEGRSTLSSDSFIKMLAFMGSNANYPYAQAYQVDRIRLYGLNHSLNK